MTRVYQEAAISVGLKLTVLDCANCGIVFGISTELEKRLRENGTTFYCPNGHSQYFANSDLKEAKQEAESLRKALAVQEAATKRERQRRENAEHSLRATKGHVTRLRKRAQAGLCPVCNRHFEALERHMHSKHPDCELEVAV